MIHLETHNGGLFEELAGFGWKHPISEYVKPGETMKHSFQTNFKGTQIRITLLDSGSPRSPEPNEFISWLVQHIEQDK